MHRTNIKQAFVGEGDPNQEGLEVEQSSDEDVEFNVVEGKIAFVVPSGTPDDEVMGHQKYTHAELVLEDGTKVTLSIHADTVGAEVAATGPDKGNDTLGDLSTASEDVQGGAS